MSNTRRYIIDEQGERIGVLLDLGGYHLLARLTPRDTNIATVGQHQPHPAHGAAAAS